MVNFLHKVPTKGDPRRSNYDLPQDLAEVAVEVQAEAKARDKE